MKAPPVNNWQLEQYLLNELPPEEMEQVRQAAETDQSVRMRLGDLQRSNQELLERYPSERMARQISQRLRQSDASPEGSRPMAWLATPAAAFAGLLLVGLGLVALSRYASESGMWPDGGTRLKGAAPHLVVHRKTPQGAELLAEGSRVREGDVLRLSYQAGDRKYGVIVSLDGRGTVTRHWPEQGEWAGELVSGKSVPLGFAYRLDDAPRGELFFFVTSDSRFPVRNVSEAVATLTRAWQGKESRLLPLPPSYTQSSVAVLKDGE
jgi:hypothetical protein